ncbi:CDP-alcohol phosphatidyltransferase family protein [Nannocystaceae bacterium ST9]
MAEPSASPAPVAAWRYVVPNAITSASLAAGLLVMVAAIESRFVDAGWLIVLCVLLDKLDGTFARLLGSTSKFGVQLDSLADLVVFGVAPAVTLFRYADAHIELYADWIGFEWLLQGSLAVFVVCSALRLAKFNVLAEDPKGPQVFLGMPTTLAGGLIGLLLLVGMSHELEGLLVAMPLIALVFGFMMVSNLVLPKIGKRGTKFGFYFQGFNLVLSYVFGFLRIFPEYMLAVAFGYALVGFVWGLIHRSEILGGGPSKPDDPPHDDPSHHGDPELEPQAS